MEPSNKLARPRSYVLLIVVLAHAALLYAAIHSRARTTFDGPSMFGPATANKPVVEQTDPLRSRPYHPPVVDRSISEVQEWHFPRVDIWPVTGEACPTPSEFGPLMDAQPRAENKAQAPASAPQPPSIPKAQMPRMVLWLRPAYPLEWAWTEREGTVRLGLRYVRPGTPTTSESSARLDRKGSMQQRRPRRSHGDSCPRGGNHGRLKAR